jgi:tripartite-type tricarboxylate transporter receptor subunit TctC
VNRLHAELVHALKLPDVREKLLSQGTEPVGDSPQAFAAFMKSEYAKWAKVIKAAHIKIE